MIFPPDIASLDEKFKSYGSYFSDFSQKNLNWLAETSWKDLFSDIAPFILTNPNELYVQSIAENSLFKRSNVTQENSSLTHLDNQVFQTIKIQLMALNLITVEYLKTTKGEMAWFWSLTQKGKKLLFETRTIKTESSDKSKV